jgi:hypothetical protein
MDAAANLHAAAAAGLNAEAKPTAASAADPAIEASPKAAADSERWFCIFIAKA